ncbi:MAG: sulfatase-like hydrolase/transferase [Bacteroidota bacterium]
MNFAQGKPNYLSELLVRFGVMLAIFQLLRIVFLYVNWNEFSDVHCYDFLVGCWFDTITIALFFLPYALVQLCPFKIKFLTKLNGIFFHVTASLLYLINIIDIEYYRYTSKRSTFDLLDALTTGEDFQQLFGTYLLDFWPLVVLFALTIFTHFRAIHYLINRLPSHSFLKLSTTFPQFIVGMLALFLVARGGVFRKPTSIVDLSRYTSFEKTSLVANSGFTMIKSFSQTELKHTRFFSEEMVDQLFNPSQVSNPQHILAPKTNVVFIVLESFGIEYIGKYSQEESYTPFLDSLIDQSMWFENGYANGAKSIEAIPAIIASIPSLMNHPYISSSFANNEEHGLANILAERGYSTAFYHGATNGSMNFDSYAKKAGFQHYFGRNEYGNDKHFDGYWGISDEYFNPWTAKKISQLKAPFFATLFTISSHHPYYIPPHIEPKIKKGPQQICASINYGDYSLRNFFETAKKQAWFNNTLFVICADHTNASATRLYKHRTIRYRIPILFYHPNGKMKTGKQSSIFQQLDIMPTVLDLLNIKTKYYAFGQSYFSENPREAIAFLQDSYFYYFDKWMLTFDGKRIQCNVINPLVGRLPNNDRIDKNKLTSHKNRLKAIVQQFNNDMLNNQITTR